MRVDFVGLLPPSLGGAKVSSWLLLQELGRQGVMVRAVTPVVAKTREAAEALRRRHPEMEIRHFELDEFPDDATKAIPEAEMDRVEEVMARELEAMAEEEKPDLLLAGREVEARCLPQVAQRLGVGWILRCGGLTLHLLEKGAIPEELRRRLLACFPTARATVVQAEHLRELAEAYGCPRVTVIPSPVDLGQFARAGDGAELRREWGIPEGAPVVLHASNFKAVKRVEEVVESAAWVLGRCPEAIYVVVGEGPTGAELRERCRARGIEASFRFCGAAPYDKMPEYLGLATVVVMPSEFEQQARMYLEAQASGRALVASDIAGAREVIETGRSGLLYPLGDVRALGEATLRMLVDGEGRERMVAQAQRRVQAHALPAVGARWREFLEEMKAVR